MMQLLMKPFAPRRAYTASKQEDVDRHLRPQRQSRRDGAAPGPPSSGPGRPRYCQRRCEGRCRIGRGWTDESFRLAVQIPFQCSRSRLARGRESSTLGIRESAHARRGIGPTPPPLPLPDAPAEALPTSWRAFGSPWHGRQAQRPRLVPSRNAGLEQVARAYRQDVDLVLRVAPVGSEVRRKPPRDTVGDADSRRIRPSEPLQVDGDPRRGRRSARAANGRVHAARGGCHE